MKLSDEERESGALSPERLRKAVRAFQDTGLVVVEEVYEPAFLAEVRAAYDQELEKYLADKGGLDALAGKTFGLNHIGFFPTLLGPIGDARIAAHPMVSQILAALLGADFTCSFYHTNTACPGSGVQPVHRDSPPLFGSEQSVPHPATSIVLNIPLCDFTVENGSTEFWPGSHLIVDQVPSDAKEMEERLDGMASIRMNLPLGSFALRDLRAWHRGMPNNATYARTMFALVYQRAWLAAKPMQIPRSVWDSWPDSVRRVYRKNPVVEDADYHSMTWEELR